MYILYAGGSEWVMEYDTTHHDEHQIWQLQLSEWGGGYLITIGAT